MDLVKVMGVGFVFVLVIGYCLRKAMRRHDAMTEEEKQQDYENRIW